MGHKVNPVGLRVGINRDWNSKWFATGDDYAAFLKEDGRLFCRKIRFESEGSNYILEMRLNFV